MIEKIIHTETHALAHEDPGMAITHAYNAIIQSSEFCELIYNGVFCTITCTTDSNMYGEHKTISLVARFTEEQYLNYEKRQMVDRLSGL